MAVAASLILAAPLAGCTSTNRSADVGSPAVSATSPSPSPSTTSQPSASVGASGNGVRVVGARLVHANGTTLYAEQTGDGPSVLFVHGMCGDARVWAGQGDRLADRFRCTTYDRRGHTRSPRTDQVVNPTREITSSTVPSESNLPLEI